jgi:hypothetical protein
MNKVDTTLACFEIASIPSGYRALDLLTREEGLRVLEASVAGGGRMVILVEGRAEQFAKVAPRLRQLIDGAADAGVIDHEIVEHFERGLSEALFSLAQVSLDEALVVVESDTVSGLLSAGQALVRAHGLKAIELKINRAAPGGYGFFTGTSAHCASGAVDAEGRWRTKMRGGKVAVIDQPTAGFREFFNFSGKA